MFVEKLFSRRKYKLMTHVSKFCLLKYRGKTQHNKIKFDNEIEKLDPVTSDEFPVQFGIPVSKRVPSN